jgi:hypothetical protein
MAWSSISAIACGFLLAATLAAETLHFNAEWRLMDAGRVRLHWASREASMKLETIGLVRKLYKVDDDYAVKFRSGWCADSSTMLAAEGRKLRRVAVDYRAAGKATYVVRDLHDNEEVVETREVAVPDCVHDVVTGLARLRELAPKASGTFTIPVSDGRKSAAVRVDVLRPETVRTPAGVFSARRYEVFLMNDVIYRRKARLFVWLTDDDRRLPVQVRLQMPVWLGTVTIQLTREEKT